LTSFCPAFDSGDEPLTYSPAPRGVIDDETHDLDLWRSDEKFALFRGDPAKKIPFGFTGGGYSDEMVWSAKQRFEAIRDFLRLGGITELARESRDFARIGQGRRTDERAPLSPCNHANRRRNR